MREYPDDICGVCGKPRSAHNRSWIDSHRFSRVGTPAAVQAEPFEFVPRVTADTWDDWNRFVKEFTEWVNR